MRYHWGLGVGHTYSHHVPSSDDENQCETSTTTEGGRSAAPLMQGSSQSQDHVGRGNDPVDSDSEPDEFVLPWDGEAELEWEVDLTDSSEEEDDSDIRTTMFALYDDDASDSD